MIYGLRLNKKEKVSRAFFSLFPDSGLWAQCNQLPHSSVSIPSLLYPKIMSLNKLFLSYVAFQVPSYQSNKKSKYSVGKYPFVV